MRKGWFRIFLLALSLSWGAAPFARAAQLTSGPSISFTNGTQAVVRWRTDVSTGTRLFFGESPQTMSRRVDGQQGFDHVAVLPSLETGTKWFYSVGTARVTLATNSFVVPGKSGGIGEKQRSDPVVPASMAPPTRETWGYLPSLQDHFDRHGRDFNAKDPDHYARLAWEFRQRALVENLPTKVDMDGVIRIYDSATGTFGAYNKNGTTKTFFKPNSRDYFDRQPGKLITPKGRN